MRPLSLAVLTPKILLLCAALWSSSEVSAQYARGDEIPLRPTPNREDVEKTMSLEEYTAQEIINKALEKTPPQPFSTLPVEKLTPSSQTGRTKTVVIEQAIFRCEKGNSFVFVDEDNKNKFSRCTLFRAEKTAEVPVDPEPVMPAKPRNSCSGTLFYQGNTYIFRDDEPCPIPESVLKQLLPVATRPF